MKKKFFGVMAILLIVVVVIFAGCNAESSVQTEKPAAHVENVGFELVYESPHEVRTDPYYAYYRDRVTNVMYVWVANSKEYNSSVGGFSVMLDPATSGPLTYEKWCQYTSGENN